MLIERECERLVMRYCHLVDHGEAAQIPDLFTDQGIWKGPGFRMVGRAELVEGLTARQSRDNLRSRHVCSTFICDVIDEDRAVGVVYLTLYRRLIDDDAAVEIDGPSAVAEYRDKFVRTQVGWRIAEREVAPAFVRSK